MKRSSKKYETSTLQLRKQLAECKRDVDKFRNGEELMRQTSENCEEALHRTDEKSYKKYIDKNSKDYNRLQKKHMKDIKNGENEYEPEKFLQCKRDLQHYKNVSVVNELFIYRISAEFHKIDHERYQKFVKQDKKHEKKDIADIEKGVDPEKLFSRYSKSTDFKNSRKSQKRK